MIQLSDGPFSAERGIWQACEQPLLELLDDLVCNFFGDQWKLSKNEALCCEVEFLGWELKVRISQAVSNVVIAVLPEDLAPEINLVILFIALQLCKTSLNAKDFMNIQCVTG